MNRFTAIYSTLSFVISISLMSAAFIVPTQLNWYEESGFIEVSTAIFFGLSGLIAFGAWFSDRRETYGLFALTMILACLRELDAHKAFTTQSIRKSRFYLSDQTPLGEKLIGFLFILLLLYTAIRLLSYVSGWLKEVFTLQRDANIIAIAFGSLCVGKFLDTSPRIFTGLQEYAYQLRAIEECLELNSAVFFVLAAILVYTKKHSKKENTTSFKKYADKLCTH